MAERWPGFSSEQRSGEAATTDSSSANGASPDEAAGEANESDEAPVASGGERASESRSAAELAEQAEASAAAGAADEGSVFLTELVRAMQTTAALERVRINEDTDRRRQAHIDEVRAREGAEADRMRELSDEQMKAIEAWASGETKRIQAERKRRATELQEALETSLAQHRSKIDREIEGVETAIATYRAEVDLFFEGLDGESDLLLIAQRAARRPIFPTLEAVPDPEPAAVGVMDPDAPSEPAESWEAAPETSPEPVSQTSSDETGQDSETGEPAEPVPATAGNPGSLFQSVSVPRPMSFLRRDPNGGDRREGQG